MEKSLFKQYAALQSKIAALEEEKGMLKEEIVAGLKKESMDKVETNFGKFTIGRSTSWKYSEAVEKIAEKLKLTKVKEEQKGIAQPSVSEYLVFTAPKND